MEPAHARVVALALRRQLADDAQPIDLDACCALLGATIEEADLGSSRGGLEAMLAPIPPGQFRITVDATPRGGWGDACAVPVEPLRRRRVRFRVCHELGHTTFYRRSGAARPIRAFPGGGVEEEAFCDEFARALLVPPSASRRTVDDVLANQERYDVSLEVAARAAATGTDAPAVALWHWSPPVDGRRAALHLQWTSSPELPARIGITQYRTDPDDLPRVLAAAKRRLRPDFSAAVLPERRQALVLAF